MSGCRRLPRPTPAATPLQTACRLLGEAFTVAHADRRALEAFVDITITRLAREALLLLDREERLS